MGHFAQYCAISRIAITGGTKCGLIILAPKSRIGSSGDMSQNPWVPVAPPVFGTYDDYGRLENIEPSATTRAIERLTKSKIKKVLDTFMSLRGDEEPHEILRGFRWAWVRTDVWDQLRTHKSKAYPEAGHFDLGNNGFLMSLGAERLEDLDVKERYRFQYRIGKNTLRSDGTWLEGSIYGVKRLGKLLDVNVDRYLSWSNHDLWRVNSGEDREAAMSHVLWIFGVDRTGLRSTSYRKMMERVDRKLGKPARDPYDIDRRVYGDAEVEKYDRQTRIINALLDQMKDDSVCEALSDVAKVVSAMHSFSSQIGPVSCYAPQDGEHEDHLTILKGFMDILKKEIKRYDA